MSKARNILELITIPDDILLLLLAYSSKLYSSIQ